MLEISISGWLGVIIAIGIVLLVGWRFIAHSKAKKKVKEGMLYGGVEYLSNALKDPKTREEAIEALGKTKDSRAVEALISFVNSPEVREEDAYLLTLALNALGQTQNPKAVNFLIDLLSDKNEFIRYYACFPLAEALKVVKNFRAVEPLINVMKDMKKSKASRLEGVDFELTAEESLKAITGESLGADPEKWEKWWEGNKKLFATGDNS